ncbi:hypothetical protein [Arthrobacter sp. zg-Y1143]|uniref:hypothetical protein n=1 Tax=Arthrobacter sp. zg-Y1143 TaxID=3049065 RepID=UPI0024C43B99|nr:hypothetical protein [Arthrobacter sp. zg-Y1143]MDK1328277.1 hypothetical protein [Arthrobacter sp. zg-Y1143]
MSHQPTPDQPDPESASSAGPSAHARPGKPRPGAPSPLRNPRTAWPVLGVVAGLLWVAVLQGVGGVAVWILAAGVLLLCSALYALGFRRRSWAGLNTLQQRKFALSVSGVVLVMGVVAGVMSVPHPARTTNDDAAAAPPPPATQPQPSSPETADPRPQDVRADVQGARLPADTPESSPAAEAALANSPCTAEGATRLQREIEYRCTANTAGQLVWMDRATADLLVEARAVAQRAEADRLQAEQAAREAARRAAEQNPSATLPPAPPPEVPGEPGPPDPPSPPDPTEPATPDPTTPPPAPGTPDPGTPAPGTPDPVTPPPAPGTPDPTVPPTPPQPDPTAPPDPRVPPDPPAPPDPTVPPPSGRSVTPPVSPPAPTRDAGTNQQDLEAAQIPAPV